MNLIPWRSKSPEQAGAASSLEEHPLARLRHDVDALFDRLLRDPFREPFWPFGENAGGWNPRMEMTESNQDVILKFDIPGVSPENVDISIAENVLTVRGEHSDQRDEKSATLHYTERSYGAFSRSVRLPGSIDPDKVDAAFKDGVLTVTIAKRPEATPKRITVKKN